MEFILGLLALVSAIYVIFSVWGSGAGTGAKIIWTIAALIFSIATAIVYYFIGPKRGAIT